MSALEITRLRSHIKTCNRCEVRELCRSPVPIEIDKIRGCELLLVGEAPGSQEDTFTRPFVGPAGQLMREMLKEAGLNDVDTGYCNVVSCFPHNLDSRKVRAPVEREINNCRIWLEEQIRIADPKVIITVGAVATKTWRSDVQVTKHHGNIGWWRFGGITVRHRTGTTRSYPIMPIVHPSSLLRGYGNRQSIIYDLRQVHDILVDRLDPGCFAWEKCVRCGVNSNYLDLDGIAYCDQHKEKWKGEAEKQRRAWGRIVEGLTKEGQAKLELGV